MPKKKKDENEIAFEGLQELLRRDAKRDGLPIEPCSEPEKLSYRVDAGRKGGEASGKARKKNLSPQERSEIARKAAKARWKAK
jgi:general stress protein YciG